MEGHGVLAEDLNQSLDSARTMQVHGDLDERGQHCLDQLLKASNWCHLNQLLAKVIAKLISHHIWENFHHRLNQARRKVGIDRYSRGVSLLEATLDHAATSLIERKHLHLLADVLLLLSKLLE